MLRQYVRNWVEVPEGTRAHLPQKVKIGIQYYRAWKRSLENGGNALSDHVPWITFVARNFLESILTPSAVVFEYGSGGSTLFYAKRAKQVISIEHDAQWARFVEAALAQAELTNCECRLVPPEKTPRSHGSPDDPEAYCSSDEQYKGYSFRDYVTSIEPFPDQFFNLVAIDGRARPSSILHGSRKVKRGGHLMLDNSERPHYQRAKALLLGWEAHSFYGPGPYNFHFWETTIWTKPPY